MSGGFLDTGMQKLTAMIFDFPPISPQVIRKYLIGHIYSRYSTSGFLFVYLILVHSAAE